MQCPCSPALTAPLSLPSVVSGDEPREKIELVSYFGKRPPGVLHCTTKFCDYGKAAGADEYAQQDVSAPRGHLAEVGRGQGLPEKGTGSRQGPQTRQPLRKRGSSIPSLPAACLVPTRACSFCRCAESAGRQQLLLWPLSLCSVPKPRSPLPPV